MQQGQWHTWEGVHSGISAAAGILVAVFVIVGLPAGRQGWESAHAAAPSVVINEVMWAGSILSTGTVSTADEWIELYNPTSSEVTIGGWKLENAGSTSTRVLILPADVTIAAGGYYIMANFAKDHASNAFKVDVDFVTSSVSLLNASNGHVVLKNSAGDVVDQAGGSPEWLAGENTSAVKKSMERGLERADGLLASSWQSSTSSADQKNYGTPHATNSVPKVNAAPVPVITAAAAAAVGQSISFSAEDSSDADGDTLTFSWAFGDSSVASGEQVSHSYATSGTFSVILTAGDVTSESEATHTVAVAAPVYSTAIVVNEWLPNPAGSDTDAEFIELKNTGADEVDLSGWKIDDASGGSTAYTIPAGTQLAGGGIKSWSRSETKIALNNTGDSVRLLNPAGSVVSSYAYADSVPDAQSYNRTDDGSYTLSTTLTPGAANVITAPASEEEDDDPPSPEASTSAKATADKSAGKVAGASAKKVELKNIRSEEDGTTITTEGVVSVPPGVLSAREMYLAGSGIQVYFQKATWPELKLGDRVRVTGELGSNRGEARLKLAAANSISRTAAGEPPAPHVIKTGEVDEDEEGWLITVQGEVVETSGDTFYVDDGSGEIKIYIREGTKIDKPKMKKGVNVTITGVVSETSTGYRILPRFQEDVRLGLVAGLTTFPATGYKNEHGGYQCSDSGLDGGFRLERLNRMLESGSLALFRG